VRQILYAQSGIRIQQQAEPVVRLFRHEFSQIPWRMHRRHPHAAGLLASADDHLLPMRLLARRLTRVQPHHAALGQQRYDFCNPQFHGFLQREIHALAARDALRQRHPQR